MPLHSAVASGQVEITRLLLRRGAPVNARQDGYFTAIHSAAQNGQLDMLDLLLVYGADLDVHSIDGKSPLDFANLGEHTGHRQPHIAQANHADNGAALFDFVLQFPERRMTNDR